MSTSKVLSLIFVFLLTSCEASGETNPLVFQSNRMTVVINSDKGSILQVRNTATKEDYLVQTDSCRIELEDRAVELSKLPMKLVGRTKNSCVFVSRDGNLEITRTYTFPAERPYFDRALSIKNLSKDKSIVIKKITDCSLHFTKPFESTAYHDDNLDAFDPGTSSEDYYLRHYESQDTVRCHTSLNVFMRNNDGGMIAGLKYPYFEPQLANDSVKLKYNTNYRVGPQQELQLPTMFCGVYKNTGYTCRKEMHWTPRLISTEQHEMDWAEVYAMQKVLRDYLPQEPCPKEGYYLCLDTWWSSPQLRGSMGEAQAARFCALFDKIQQSQCIDMVLIAPVWVGLSNYLTPCPELDAVGEDAVFPINPHIKRVVDYAQSTGVHLAGQGEPSARVREYRKDRPDWKIHPTEDPNKVLKQNCQANDEYAEWFYRFICNTIDSCKLQGWSWDFAWVRKPMICYGNGHGHELGNCDFQQYHNVTALIGKLRQRYPNHVINIYWGLKLAGTWSHKGLNFLENIYENNFFPNPDKFPAPPGMTAADDLRFQFWYNHNYRFFPTYMNFGQIIFTEEGTWPGDSPIKRKETEISLANPHLYSILSALSASTVGVLSDWRDFKTQDEADEIFKLLRKWKGWASENMDYLRDRIDLFGQPYRKGGIDGSAHIIGDRGFVFVFNPWTEKKWGSIQLNKMIGLEKGDSFSLEEISTDHRKRLGVCKRGENFIFSVQPKSAMLIEIKPTSEELSVTKELPAKVEIQPAFRK